MGYKFTIYLPDEIKAKIDECKDDVELFAISQLKDGEIVEKIIIGK